MVPPNLVWIVLSWSLFSRRRDRGDARRDAFRRLRLYLLPSLEEAILALTERGPSGRGSAPTLHRRRRREDRADGALEAENFAGERRIIRIDFGLPAAGAPTGADLSGWPG